MELIPASIKTASVVANVLLVVPILPFAWTNLHLAHERFIRPDQTEPSLTVSCDWRGMVFGLAGNSERHHNLSISKPDSGIYLAITANFISS